MKKILLLLTIFVFATSSVHARGGGFETVFPKTAQAEFILYFEDLPQEIRSKRLVFQVSETGHPVLIVDNILMTFKHGTDSFSGTYEVPNVDVIDHAAWMRNGDLLMISGNKMGEVTETGFEILLTLPDEGMKVEPASVGQAYLYGGSKKSQRKHLYLYKEGGKLMHLLRTPSPINAVAGYGELTIFAMGRSIYMLAEGEPMTHVYITQGKATSLAIAPNGGIFYATDKEVGYITGRDQGYPIIKGQGAQVVVRGDDVYLFFPESGIFKISPASSFEDVANSPVL